MSVSSSPVGYKRAPVHSRFKPGESGNPKGRPRGETNLADLTKRVLNAPVWVTIAGKRQSMSTAEATIRKVMQDALRGDNRSLNLLMEILEMSGRTEDIAEEEREKRVIRLPR